MYSKDVDQLISCFDNVINATINVIKPLASACKYQLSGPDIESPNSYSLDVSSIKDAIRNASKSLSGAKNIGDNIYSGSGGFISSSGSPWTEIERCKSEVESLPSGSLSFLGDKVDALARLEMILPLAVDAKLSVMNAHDILTRGFDNTQNGNNPSITWDKSVDGRKTNGNRANKKSNNVKMPVESDDPY